LIDLRGSIMPTNSRRDSDPQSDLLSTIRESQAAMLDVVRSWTDVSQQVTRSLPLPVAGGDIASFVDRVFDLAEQTLAAQRQLALTLAGIATRQADTAVETIDTAVETTVRASAHPVEELLDAPRTSRRSATGSALSSRRPPRVPRPRLSRPSRTPNRTGAATRSAASRSSATGLVSWKSKAAHR
jgi:hypothetical protein